MKRTSPSWTNYKRLRVVAQGFHHDERLFQKTSQLVLLDLASRLDGVNVIPPAVAFVPANLAVVCIFI
jgi:hypothetical protein